ncbi:hypothetical protein HK099_008605 [Clydaea vesicula]|uniref:Calpain catalytic domain-containing protein n=1 Tax=Clydaea vesicula TaxID=447962 RepID=A0AAD5TVL3_9FUNG|nr:hypothetical protein HK099_008605 [Clydaea vesicula]
MDLKSVTTSLQSGLKVLSSTKKRASKRSSLIRGHVPLTENIDHAKNTKASVATQGLLNARQKVKELVNTISKECRTKNVKFRDCDFDLQKDLNCIFSFDEEVDSAKFPAGVSRVTKIFDNPTFYRDGINHMDIKQGADGDCWFLSALAIASNIPRIIENLCVARDEEVGVYGFIFFRDNNWLPVIIDDQLYVGINSLESAPPILKAVFRGKDDMYQKVVGGSNTLHFSKCRDPNETWLPLLEKAFAKANGDYKYSF